MNLDMNSHSSKSNDISDLNKATLQKKQRLYNSNEDGKDLNIFHRKNDIQYSASRSGPFGACFSFVAHTLKSFATNGLDGVSKDLELSRCNKESSFLKNVEMFNEKHRSSIHTNVPAPVIESNLYRELGFLSSESRSFVVRHDMPIRHELSSELIKLEPGYYSIGLESLEHGHELGFVKDTTGASYLIDSNRGIREYKTNHDLTEDLGKTYPPDHKKHFVGKDKFKYLSDYHFFRFTITERIPN